MANRTTSSNGDHSQKTSWLDSFPHDFTGWGPKTPDPEHPELTPPGAQLTWDGGDERTHHVVWRFDSRRHHH